MHRGTVGSCVPRFARVDFRNACRQAPPASLELRGSLRRERGSTQSRLWGPSLVVCRLGGGALVGSFAGHSWGSHPGGAVLGESYRGGVVLEGPERQLRLWHPPCGLFAALVGWLDGWLVGWAGSSAASGSLRAFSSAAPCVLFVCLFVGLFVCCCCLLLFVVVCCCCCCLLLLWASWVLRVSWGSS